MFASLIATVIIFTYQKQKTFDFETQIGGLVICLVPFLFMYSPIAALVLTATDNNTSWQVITLCVVAALAILVIIGNASEGELKRNKPEHVAFVKTHSTLYKNLRELNGRQKFHEISWDTLITYPLSKFCDTYAQYNRTSTSDLFQEFIELNIAKLGEMVRLIKKNIILNTVYIKEYKMLLSSPFVKKNDKGKLVYGEGYQEFSKTMKPKKFLEIEGYLYKKGQLDPSVVLAITCEVRYISPAGRNSYENKRTYNLENLETWLDIVVRNVKNRSERQNKISHERARVTNSVRYNILKRDGHSCKICGSTASDGVKLHVDHVVPVSKGGTSDNYNLQTLCDRCNSGKSNKFDGERIGDIDFDDLEEFLESGDLEDLV